MKNISLRLRTGVFAAALACVGSLAHATEFRSSDIHPEDYPTVMAVKQMSEEIKQKTGGKHTIRVFTGNQLAMLLVPMAIGGFFILGTFYLWTPALISGAIGIAIAAFDFDHGTLFFTEAGSRKRASLTLVRGEDALKALDISSTNFAPGAVHGAISNANSASTRSRNSTA